MRSFGSSAARGCDGRIPPRLGLCDRVAVRCPQRSELLCLRFALA